MKKLLILFSVYAMLVFPQSANADYAYDLGRAIGNAMGNEMGNAGYKGDIDKTFYADENYNFEKLNSFLIVARIAPETANYVFDPYIAAKLPNIIKKEIGEKYNIKTMNDVTKQYYELHPEAIKLPQKQQTKEIVQFAQTTNDALIFANIQAYFVSGRTNNAKVEFYITPVGAQTPIFHYTESRLNVERGTKERTISKIAENFADKFKDTFTQKL